MTGPPTADQWRFASGFSPERLEQLERPLGFEEIGRAIVREAHVKALPIEIGALDDVRGCRRPVFHLTVEPATFDRFLNGRDGYRARFWQSPEVGERASRWLLGELSPKLVDAMAGPNAGFAASALSRGSATIWFREQDALGAARLQVEQWEEAVRGGGSLSAKARDGRWAPTGSTLEIRGAFMSDRGEERIDSDKIERSMELHLAGYT